MSQNESHAAPKRTAQHEALGVFLGEWRSEGWSYGRPDQRADAPKSLRDKWTGICTGAWHSGAFFLIQDERVTIGTDEPSPFDTISVMGVDADTGDYFARSFENHGYSRHYAVKREGNVWTLEGATERARIEFSEDARTQTVRWEWLREGKWLPLCDQTVTRA